MDVRVESLVAGAQRAGGVVVIVDVFRAFTTAAVAFWRGVEKIVMVAEIDEALALRAAGVGDFCVGEVDGKRPEGFDFGNSPHEIAQAELAGKTLIQSTRAGTVGVTSATGATAIYGGSLVVARATAEAILHDKPDLVTIVAMGWSGRVRTDEDELCALYIRNLLEGRDPDPEALKRLIEASGEVGKFHDPAQPHFHPEDVQWSLKVNHFDFAIGIEREGDYLVARPKR